MPPPDGHSHPRSVGRYVLHGELASGGMATVHFGRLSGPVGFSRTVAIKRLHPHYAKDPEFVSMFLDEARLVGRIRHPNVVPTLDVVTTDGEVFLVMEYVAGEALSKLLKTAWQRHLPVPPRVAAAIVASVLHGLHAAHQAKDEHGRELGIVHRDVSPQNILVGADGTARVLDFGVAKAAGRLQTTRDGQVKGKIAYMPPEQLSGGAVTQKADIYAASVVLWEALAGRRLFDAETEALVLVRAIESRIDPPSLVNPGLDPAFDAVVLRGLARDPAHRFATARDMAVAIEQSIGIASAYEVGEWVELVGGEDLRKRAARVAEVESSSLDPLVAASAPKIAHAPAEPPHSQVSSISVSRPAVSQRPAAKRRTGPLYALFGVLAVSGLVLGGLALKDTLRGRAHAAKANDVEPDRQPLSMLPPTSAPAKGNAPPSPSDAPSTVATASAAPSATPAAVTTATAAAVTPAAAPPPAATHAVASPAPKPAAPPPPKKPATASKACDPPYTIDLATGRKKYKVECL